MIVFMQRKNCLKNISNVLPFVVRRYNDELIQEPLIGVLQNTLIISKVAFRKFYMFSKTFSTRFDSKFLSASVLCAWRNLLSSSNHNIAVLFSALRQLLFLCACRN